MSGFDWLNEFVTRMHNEHVVVHEVDANTLAPAQCIQLDVEDWGNAARVAASFGCRWAGVWGDTAGEHIVLRACVVYQGDYLVLRTDVPLTQPILPSHTPHYPGADRMERHLQDMFGIAFSDHPDPRRWTRHKAWPADQYPLRNEFPVSGLSPKRTPADSDYAFVQVLGNGVYEIPVGPVHAGIIEPGHFRFHVVGEEVLRLEARLGYVHKGIEKIAIGRDANALVRLAARISGDSTVAHSWAACMALERAAKVHVPPRALALRAILAERERIANHLGDIGAICNDVAFAFAHMQFSRLREDLLRSNQVLFGHRLLMDRIVPGGVTCDLDDAALALLRTQLDTLTQAVNGLCAILDDHPSLEDRLVAAGILQLDLAKRLGVLGYVAKASGQDLDVRRDHTYAPYDHLSVESPCLSAGDVAARVQVRATEIRQSLSLLQQLFDSLPAGNIQTPWPVSVAASAGMGMLEGWRGEIISYVRVDEDGKVLRFFARDPSWFNWPALEQLIHGNIVADFPVCNKSVNGSYSGSDL
jgi:Ni,Fe-hydrogenase III large subunit/Ni,Fe-hydrogenase III component G